jgi:hypothetical protein
MRGGDSGGMLKDWGSEMEGDTGLPVPVKEVWSWKRTDRMLPPPRLPWLWMLLCKWDGAGQEGQVRQLEFANI